MQPIEAPCEDYVVKTRWSRFESLSGMVEGFDLLDRSGNIKWSVEVNSPAFLEALDNGYALMIRELAPEGSMVSLEFFDAGGKTQKKRKIAYFSGLKISSSHERILVNFRSGLSLFSLDGELLNEYPGVFTGMALDDAGEMVAMSGADSLFIYRGNENLARIHLSNSYVREMNFSEGGGRVAVLTPAGIETWDNIRGTRVYDLGTLRSSPKHVSFSETGERLLVALQKDNVLKLLVIDYENLSPRLSIEPLSSPDEAVIEVLPENDGWLVHLTSGWYRFIEGEE